MLQVYTNMQEHVKRSHVTLECVHFVLANFTNSTPSHVASIISTSLEVHSNHKRLQTTSNQAKIHGFYFSLSSQVHHPESAQTNSERKGKRGCSG